MNIDERKEKISKINEKRLENIELFEEQINNVLTNLQGGNIHDLEVICIAYKAFIDAEHGKV